MDRTAKIVVRLVLVTVLWPSAFGLDPSLDINQYAHRAWTVNDGFFKGSVYAIAQTSDGYLWLGTDVGLTRFDGVRGFAWQLPHGEHLPAGRVRSLLAARDGRLWIGTDEGLASWKEDKLTLYPELAGKYVLSILEDHDGAVWAAAWGVGATAGRLCTIRGTRVDCYGDDGRFGNGIDGLYQDRRGTLWAGNVDGVWRWSPGPPKFLPMHIVTSSFAEGDGGELYVATLEGIRTLFNDQPGPYLVRATGRQSKFGRLLRDREGGIWAGTYDGGLLHVHHGKTDRFARSDGLSSDNILCLFEDREGNIWVGTRNGLDRFREFAVPAITEQQGLSNSSVSSILQGRDGSIWLGTVTGLNRWQDGRVTIYGKTEGLPDLSVLSLFEDRAGRIWMSTRRGIGYLDGGRFVAVPAVRSGSVVCFIEDDAGGIWISDQTTLYHLEHSKVVEQIPWAKLGHNDFAWIMLFDSRRGGIWLGFRQGGVAFFQDGSIRMSYGREQGFGSQQVRGLKLDDDGSLWAASGEGLNVIRNKQTFRLSGANGLPCDIVHWVQEDSDRSFWLYTACGLVRIERSEMLKWIGDPKTSLRITVLDDADGVRSSVAPADSNPIVTRMADGKIWFLPKNGVGVLDPHSLHQNKLAPPVHIEQITADNNTYDAVNGLRLPPRVRYLAIDYTALSYSAPEKVRFRYKLEGEDKNWREVVNDRQVQYTNLRPGNYRFRVLACNNTGIWNQDGDSFNFVIPPTWYQTNWFRAACVVVFLAMIWGIYQFRVHQLAHEFNLSLEARVNERTRLARDIHDTLLQSFQGLLMRFQTVSHLLPARPIEAKEQLDTAIEQAEDAIIEGRDAVKGLRVSTMERNSLAKAIGTLGEELARNPDNPTSPGFTLEVQGDSRDLHPILRDEVYRIAAEALRNAFRHALAHQIEVEIRYDERRFQLRVRDDGAGFDPELPALRRREGHYGLPGMAERAKIAGGTLRVWSEIGAGTEVELQIPAARAYAKTKRSWFAEKVTGKAAGQKNV